MTQLPMSLRQIEAEAKPVLPPVEGEAAGLPPAPLIVAFAAVGGLFGMLGAVIAATLAAALYAPVKLLYLGEDPQE